MTSTVGAESGSTATRATSVGRSTTDRSDAGYGWVAFAGVMLVIVGSLNVIYGIAAISDSRFYVRDVAYVLSDLNTWGWVLLLLGIAQFVAAFGILFQTAGARWAGVVFAAGNMIVQLLVLPAAPFLAIAVFSIDILVIYGLIAHGRRAASV